MRAPSYSLPHRCRCEQAAILGATGRTLGEGTPSCPRLQTKAVPAVLILIGKEVLTAADRNSLILYRPEQAQPVMARVPERDRPGHWPSELEAQRKAAPLRRLRWVAAVAPR